MHDDPLSLRWQVILQMLFGICQAVYNCHLKKIIHRDIKPENILLDSRRRIKLGGHTYVSEGNVRSLSLSLQLILVWPEY